MDEKILIDTINGIDFNDLTELDDKKEIEIDYKKFPKTKFRKYNLPDGFYSSVHKSYEEGFDKYILSQNHRYFVVHFNK